MPRFAEARGADMKSRDFDALIAHLGELGVLDREDLMLMHLIPSHERLSYVHDRASAAVDQWFATRKLEQATESPHTCGTCGKEIGLVHCIRDGLPICVDCLLTDKICPSCKRIFHHSADATKCPACGLKLAARES
jgi:hypothetical protein